MAQKEAIGGAPQKMAFSEVYGALQLARAIRFGECDGIVASHEVEDEIKVARGAPEEQG